MTQQDAVRSFAKPGYCPTSAVRIMDAKWYLVTFQNVESDSMTDYIGLGQGEYTVLLPGRKAREAKTARLNHCNAITEWRGPVYQLQQVRHGRNYYNPTWATSEAEVVQAQTREAIEYHDFLRELAGSLQKNLANAETETNQDRKACYRKMAADCDFALAHANNNPWAVRVEQVR